VTLTYKIGTTKIFLYRKTRLDKV